jgi:hypothetical protein
LRPGEIVRRTNPLDSPFRLADILVASTYASFNAAYVYPQFTAFHELFGVGAWLGNLLRGRAALMPMFVADQVLDRMGRHPVNIDSDLAQCDRWLAHHINDAVGIRKLVKIARRVMASGRPAIVRPNRRAPQHVVPHVWNHALWCDIAASLKISTPFDERIACYNA